MDEVKKVFYGEVVAAFPQLCLCSNNWKSKAVTTARYSSWAQTYLKDLKESGKCQVKLEGGSIEPDAKRLKTDPTVMPDKDEDNKSDTVTTTDTSTEDIHMVPTVTLPTSENVAPQPSLPEEFPVMKNPL